MVIKAIFERDKFRVHAVSDNYTMGNATPYDSLCEFNSLVELKAIAEPGYKFVRWNDGNTSPTRTYTVLAEEVFFTAYFEEDEFLVTTDVNDPNLGSVTPATQKHKFGEELFIKATPEKGYKLVQWQGGGTDNPRRYVVKALPDTLFKAEFGPAEYKVTVKSDNYGMGSVEPASPAQYFYLSTVTMQAKPERGYKKIQEYVI